MRNRIKELRMMKASEIQAHPENWRQHPPKQKKALRAVLDEIGYANAVIAYESDEGLRLIDGHLRRDVAGDEEIPVLVTDLTEDEARAALATMDPLAMMADSQADLLLNLTDGLQDFESVGEVLGALFGLAENPFPEETVEEEAQTEGDAGEPVLKRGDVPDAIWPTDNDYEIPLLDVAMQADALDLPVSVWGFVARKGRMNGTWVFYTDDYRFEALWADPSGVVNTGAVNAVEPNFSTNDMMPFPVGLWGIYRKRWLARWWQSRGVRVFVDLNVDEKFSDVNMLGVPVGWKAYATRGYERYLDDLDRQYEIAAERAGCTPLFVVYGGGKAVQQRARERGWLWVVETMTAKKQGVMYGAE